jgi:hypothetical protein
MMVKRLMFQSGQGLPQRKGARLGRRPLQRKEQRHKAAATLSESTKPQTTNGKR